MLHFLIVSPDENPALYLQSLVFLYDISKIIPASLMDFAFNNASILLKILNRFDTIAYQAFTLSDVEKLIADDQQSVSQLDLLDEKIICVLLNWPLETTESMKIALKNQIYALDL